LVLGWLCRSSLEAPLVLVLPCLAAEAAMVLRVRKLQSRKLQAQEKPPQAQAQEQELEALQVQPVQPVEPQPVVVLVST